jgi:hypothetical protein
MIPRYGDKDVKEFKTRLTHWEKVHKEYRLETNLQKTVMLKHLINGGKNTVVKINEKEITEVDGFFKLENVVEKNGKIQNKTNEGIGKASKFYHLAKSFLLWNKDMAGKCKITIYNVCRGSSGSIVSDYGLDDRAIEVRSPTGEEDFSSSPCVQTGSGAHPASYPMGTGVLSPGVKRSWGMTLTTHPHLVPRLSISRSYTSSPPMRLHGM